MKHPTLQSDLVDCRATFDEVAERLNARIARLEHALQIIAAGTMPAVLGSPLADAQSLARQALEGGEP